MDDAREMTREEAINILYGIRADNLNFDDAYTKDKYDALTMAIKTLEQEPCKDAISRQAVLEGIEELKRSPWATDKRGNGFEYLITEALDVVADLCVKQEPSVKPQSCEDVVNRQAVDTLVDELARAISDERCCISRGRSTATIMQDILDLPPVKQESYDFAKWVAKEIFDEWEYNKDSFAEIACRKLAELGIVRAKGDEWELIEEQERSEE